MSRSTVLPSTSAAACALPDPAALEKRGIGWIAASFLLCPCHLPLTLGLLGSLLGGTALGTLVHGHIYLVGGTVTLIWATGTWFGARHLRNAARYTKAVRRMQAANAAIHSPVPSDPAELLSSRVDQENVSWNSPSETVASQVVFLKVPSSGPHHEAR